MLLASCGRSGNDLEPGGPRVQRLNYDERDGTINYAMESAKILFPRLFRDIIDGNIDVSDVFYTEQTLTEVYPNYADYASGNNDTIFHIFNFGDNEGFAICSRLLGVVVISDNGHVGLSDFSQPVSDDWIQTDQKYVPTTIVDQCALLAQMGLLAYRETEPTTFQYIIDPLHVSYVKPTRSVVGKFVLDQSYPFNMACPTGNPLGVTDAQGHMLAGCGPIAVANVFAANRYPNNIGGSSGTWTELIDTLSVTGFSAITPKVMKLANWLRFIGNDCGTLYTTIGSAVVLTENIADCFRMYPGYTNVSVEPVQMGSIRCFDYLSNDKPLVIRAEEESGGISTGHYWALDGYCIQTKTVRRGSRITGEYTDRQVSYPMVFCNFGWGRRANGYYNFGWFDTAQYLEVDSLYNMRIIHCAGETRRYFKNFKLVLYDKNY